MSSSIVGLRTIAVATFLLAAGACASSSNSNDGSPPDMAAGGTGVGGAGGSGGAGELRWYKTCGAPICGPDDAGAPSGVSACTTEKVGAACSSNRAMCDPGEGCGVLLRCTDRDPRAQPGGCPISRRSYKTDVRYLGDADLANLEGQTRSLRLARYRYKDAPARERLGLLIDDVPGSTAVDEPRDMIDLYAYTSMVVATVQRQAARLDQQQGEIARLRAEVRRLGARR